jgi:hypothetical protein
MTIAGTVPVSAPVQPTPLVPSSGAGTATPSGGVSFGDILDTINPLQHIPVLSSLYRAATGSKISAGSQIAGDTLYGALLPGGAVAGLLSSSANVAVKAVTGEDIGEHVVNTLVGTPPAAPAPAGIPLVASTATTPAPATHSLPTFNESYRAHATSGQYQRAQTLDSVNKMLVKMSA